MSPRTTGGLGLVRSSNAGKPTWTLVGTGTLAHARTDHVHTTDLEATTVDKQLLRSGVEDVMAALDHYSATLASTPGGAAGSTSSTSPCDASSPRSCASSWP